MERTRRTLLGAVAGTLAVAGCLGDGGGDETTAPATDPGATAAPETTTAPETTQASTGAETTTAPETTMAGAEPTVQVRSHPDLGDVLVGPEGLTLYMFDRDERGAGTSSCSGGCADAWPPLTVDGEPAAGAAVTAELTTFDRGDGTTQVAANGWPLYYYANDSSPGDATGQGANDVWWVLAPDGSPLRPSGTTTGGTETGDDGPGPY